MRTPCIASSFILTLIAAIGFASSAEAKTILTDVPRASWARYGINPWKLDTDNDGIKDSEEIAAKQCPTNADPTSLTDKNCKRGTFNLKTETYTAPAGANFLKAREIKKFRSCTELTAAFKTAQLEGQRDYYMPEAFGISQTILTSAAREAVNISAPAAAGLPAAPPIFSTTNIQVQGVDEGDIVKTDGKTIYYLKGGSAIYITSADPNKTEPLGVIPISTIMQAQEMYLADNKLVVVGRAHYGLVQSETYTLKNALGLVASSPVFMGSNRTIAAIFDVSNPERTSVPRVVEITGNLRTSRLTNGYLYLILNQSIPYYLSPSAATDALPQMRNFNNIASITTVADSQSAPGFKPLANCTNVEYLYPNRGTGYVEIVAIPVNDAKAAIGSKVIWGVGSADEIYVSPTNLYIASPNYQYRFWRGTVERSELYKFSLNKNTIKFVAAQTVPGHVLNQFSMDEQSGLLRLVTTERERTRTGDFVNHLFVLNDDLSNLGSVDRFAPTERIYSARFMGDRAYVVTFRTVDPFIVFDLKDPRSPQYIGELKIPGFSTYLHPYDATHIIGIGRNTGADENGTVWTEGIKLGLFDVTNPNIPTQMFSTTIGDRGTDSIALDDHHAFLFSREKNLLAFPVRIHTFTDEQKNSTTTRPWEYGSQTFQGLLAYRLDLMNGFREIGRVTHHSTTTPDEVCIYSAALFGCGSDEVRRSFYINDNLYVFSDKQMTVHSLGNLLKLSEVKY